MVVRALASDPDVTLFNEDHPAVFKKSHILSLDAVEAAAKSSESRVALFKPISDTKDIFQIGARFPDARHILCLRHYLPVIHSYAAAFPKRGVSALQNRLRVGLLNNAVQEINLTIDHAFEPDPSDFESMIALSWSSSCLVMRNFFDANKSRAFWAIYEDFIHDPRRAIDQIAAFCELNAETVNDRLIAQKTNGQLVPNIHPSVRLLAESLYISCVTIKSGGNPLLASSLARYIQQVYQPASDRGVSISKERLARLQERSERLLEIQRSGGRR